MSADTAGSTPRGAVRAKHLRPTLDAVDRALLGHLERDARIPNNALAELVGIAPSTCLTRVRLLRERGVIRGYHADIDPAATGNALQAMIAVRLQSTARGRMDRFVERATVLPAVHDVYFVAGVDDYLLHVATADTAALRDVVAVLNADPDVAGTQTSLIFEHTRPRRSY